MRIRKIVCAGALSGVLALTGTGVAYAEVPDIATVQAEAVEIAAPSALETAVTLTESSAEYSVSTNGSTVEVSKSSDASIELSSPQGTVNLQIDADIVDVSSASDARTVSYQHENGDASVVNVNEDGSVRVTSLIKGASSPQEFSYEYPGIELIQLPDGGVVGYDAAGELQLVVELPWAFDADGTAVPTRYAVSGSTLFKRLTMLAVGTSIQSLQTLRTTAATSCTRTLCVIRAHKAQLSGYMLERTISVMQATTQYSRHINL